VMEHELQGCRRMSMGLGVCVSWKLITGDRFLTGY
jgi:hypothetical protein